MTTLTSNAGQTVVQISFGDLAINPDLARYERGDSERGLNRWLTERHVLKFADLSAWREAYQTLLDGDRVATVRLGVNAGDDIVWQPAETRYVTGVQTDSTSATAAEYGPMVVLTMADNLFRLATTARSAAYTGQFGDLATVFSQRCGLDLQLEATQPRTVALVQALESDFSFFSAQVRPRLVTAGGLSGYMFYQRADQLFVHTPGWDRARTWTTAIGTDVLVTSWSIRDQLGKMQVGVRDGVNLVAVDPLVGSATQLVTSPDLVNTFGPAAWAYSRPQVVGRHVGQNGADDELARLQDDYAWARFDTAGARLIVTNEPGVSPGDLVIVDTPGQDPGAGHYLVSQVVSELTAGNLRSLVTLSRGEVSLVGSAPGTPLPAPQPADATLVDVTPAT